MLVLINALMIVKRGLPAPMRCSAPCGRARADPVHAVRRSQTGRVGERRARRPDRRLGRRASLDRQFPACAWLATRRGLGRGPNFAALLEWNAAPIDAKTIGEFAARLAQPQGFGLRATDSVSGKGVALELSEPMGETRRRRWAEGRIAVAWGRRHGWRQAQEAAAPPWNAEGVNDHRLKAVASGYGLKPDWVGPRGRLRHLARRL